MTNPKQPRLAQRQNVLADHQKRGKKLIPPYVTSLGRPKNISWIDTIIPEVIWIALLHEKYGHAEGTALALSLAEAAERAAPQRGASFFAAASDFSKLNADQKTALLEELAFSKRLVGLERALFPLMHFYPMCPLNFLSSGAELAAPSHALQSLKAVLRELFDKEMKRTVFVQATVVYLAFVLGRLKVGKGLTLARFPEVENYPDTEISKRIAAALRPAVLSFFGIANQETQSCWPTDFWNRGIEIEACTFTRISGL